MLPLLTSKAGAAAGVPSYDTSAIKTELNCVKALRGTQKYASVPPAMEALMEMPGVKVVTGAWQAEPAHAPSGGGVVNAPLAGLAAGAGAGAAAAVQAQAPLTQAPRPEQPEGQRFSDELDKAARSVKSIAAVPPWKPGPAPQGRLEAEGVAATSRRKAGSGVGRALATPTTHSPGVSSAPGMRMVWRGAAASKAAASRKVANDGVGRARTRVSADGKSGQPCAALVVMRGVPPRAYSTVDAVPKETRAEVAASLTGLLGGGAAAMGPQKQPSDALHWSPGPDM